MTAGFPLETVFTLEGDLADYGEARVVTVADEVVARIATTTTPQAPIAVAVVPVSVIPDLGDLLVAWGVGDPGNVGTLIRTAAAFGFGFVCGPDTADPWSPKVVRAAAGASFRTAIGNADTIEELRAGGRRVLAAVASGGVAPVRGPEAIALVIGSEAHGLPDDVVVAADLRVTIPMSSGSESLNAAVAGSILAYALRS
ncbi:MAG: RNA methyltransferase [Acidimicrobiia bacterium]